MKKILYEIAPLIVLNLILLLLFSHFDHIDSDKARRVSTFLQTPILLLLFYSPFMVFAIIQKIISKGSWLSTIKIGNKIICVLLTIVVIQSVLETNGI